MLRSCSRSIPAGNVNQDIHNNLLFSDCSSSPTCTIPKGIPFLSERSKHRVEAADNAGDDDGRKLERLLIGESGFEEILREVSLL